MAEPGPWVLLCKPLRPPFRDGTSVLVRTLLRHLPPSLRTVYFGDPQAPVRDAGDRVLPAAAMGYQPRALDKATMLARLLGPPLHRVPVHGFFAANLASSVGLAALRRLPRRRVVLQTLPASTGAERIVRALDRLDGVIVTSDWGRQRLLDAGLPGDRVQRIYPGVELPPGPGVELPPGPAGLPLAERRTVLYAGDLDPAVGERLVAVAEALRHLPGWCLEIAVRPKAEHDAQVRQRLAARLGPALARGHVRLRGEVSDMPALLQRTAMQLYLADHARRKVDIPLALLEGMAVGVPVAVIDAPPVNELAALDARHGHGGCVRLRPHALAADLAALGERLLDPADLQALGEGARALVCDHFSAAATAAQYLREYQRWS